MRRLYYKIFLWFWLGIVVVSATLVAVAGVTHTRADDDKVWEDRDAPRIHMWAHQEVEILRAEGSAGLQKYVASFQIDPGIHNYMFDASGRDVLGRAVPEPVQRVLASMSALPDAGQRVAPDERIIAEKVIDPVAGTYVVMVDYPAPSVLSRSLFEFLFEDLGRVALVRLALVLGVAGVFCFWLARQIVNPIDRLRLATKELAREHLQTRVDKTVLARRDELAELGQDFDRMAERIESLVTTQRDLMADVSHALRSPLARLNVALGLARREPAAAEHLDRIEQETDRLNKLIGQLLTMARVDSGVDLGRRTQFDLGALVYEVAADADYEARSRHCAVVFRQRQEYVVEASRELLRGAVENVVRNAVRHTADRSTVDISMECRTDAAGTRAVVRVRDHGAGVPDAAVASLFTPFHRLEDASQRFHGSGRGLAITRRTFEVHGGSAGAENAPGGGLVVTMELPLSPVVEGRATSPALATAVVAKSA